MSVAQLQQSEKQFQAAVIELARTCQWRVAHFHDSRREVKRRDGSTRIIGDRDAKGFPDLVLCRGPRLMFAELKAEKGRLSVEQNAWQEALLRVAMHAVHVQVFVWRPSQWSEIEQVLR